MSTTRTSATRTLAALTTAGLIAGGAVALAGPADASGGRPGVSASGACSGAATWKLKAKPDDPNVIAVEASVDSNIVGQNWRWGLLDNGVRVAFGQSVTTAPSGSFTASRVITDRTGSDTIRFYAVFAGQVCEGTVTL